jgi:hypothetical protein
MGHTVELFGAGQRRGVRLWEGEHRVGIVGLCGVGNTVRLCEGDTIM